MPKTSGDISKTILTIVGAAGVISLAIVAPNFFQVFGTIKQYKNWQYRRSLNRLKNKKLILVKQQKRKMQVRLTKLGYQKISRINLRNIKINRQSRWDKKWRLVMFDIPVSQNKARREFTRFLRKSGFVMLQKSVWVCPWPCEAEVQIISTTCQVHRFAKVIIAEKIPDQLKLVKHFELI